MWLDSLKEMKSGSGLTTKEISDGSGIPEPTLEKLFAGATKDPKLTTMQQLVRFFGYTLDDLDERGAAGDHFSKREKDHIQKYRLLDPLGKEAVDGVLEVEYRRYLDFREEKLQQPGEEPKTIPLFWSSAAAGYASPILGQDFDNYDLKPEDPQGAMFAVKVSGDSMEPYFPDGSIVFCNKDPIENGEVGVFCLDGESFIKQYLYNPVMRMTYLFSLNRKRANADKLITSTGGQTLTCMGRVMTKKRFPIPGFD